MAFHRVFLITIIMIVVGLIWNGEVVESRRGCSSFGHSCYGGMGKRFGSLENNKINGFKAAEDLNNVYSLKEVADNARFDVIKPNLPLTNYKKIITDENKQINKFLQYLIEKYNEREEE